MTLLIVDMPGGRSRYIIRRKKKKFVNTPVWNVKKVRLGTCYLPALIFFLIFADAFFSPSVMIDDSYEKDM